jgi:kynurenine formamidase
MSNWNEEMVDQWLVDKRNWSRWGPNDEEGATNLIDNAKRIAAAHLVKSGTAVSLSAPVHMGPGSEDLQPAQHYVRRYDTAVVDFIDMPIHGVANTHLDALGHVWDKEGMWNGRNPDDVVHTNGLDWSDVDVWRDGIITRGVLLDVPRFRGTEYVTFDDPVTGSELEAVAMSQGIKFSPGDALIVSSGRQAWTRENGSWGKWSDEQTPGGRILHHHPGLDISCIQFIREIDCAIVIWDMHDASDHGYERPWTTHSIIWAFGVAVVDGARLDRLSTACENEGRWEFLLMVAPLRIARGTGSPVNPIAIL